MTDDQRKRLAALLDKPDETSLLGLGGKLRGRSYILARDPKRDTWVMKRELGIAYAERMRRNRAGP